VPLVLEYEEVLMRLRNDIGLSVPDVNRLLDGICFLNRL
jgi:hypothetical protein